jgi:hypothetical protein
MGGDENLLMDDRPQAVKSLGVSFSYAIRTNRQNNGYSLYA